jgi:hypothetical protein
LNGVDPAECVLRQVVDTVALSSPVGFPVKVVASLVPGFPFEATLDRQLVPIEWSDWKWD